MPDRQRLIAHLDMDAFYASVELLRYPELSGLPVVIGGGRRHAPVLEEDPLTGEPRRVFARLGDYVGRGVITTATYPARDFGVRSGMGLMKAARLAPQAVLLPIDMDEYRRLSRLFKAAVRAIAPLVEDRGVDEIYIDLTDVVGDVDDPWWAVRDVARAIKAAVKNATGLTCSIGITSNKLLSKIASELDKPDGLTVLRPADVEQRIQPLPASRINGIGPKAYLKLQSFGIVTIADLAARDPAWLVAQFGRSYGAWLHAAAHGLDDRPVVTSSEPQSISRETTFERDLHAVRDRAELSALFTDLCEHLADDLARKRYLSRSIGIKLRFDDFRTVTRVVTLPQATGDAAAIRRAAGECLKRVDLARRIRLLGVRAEALVAEDRLEPDERLPQQAGASAGKAATRRVRPVRGGAPSGAAEPSPTDLLATTATLPLFEDLPVPAGPGPAGPEPVAPVPSARVPAARVPAGPAAKSPPPSDDR
ncbi:MAG TPA: DNA polymerase IV [Burkholderiaceae bacterium]|nr:DNA polymerase IV [Burkholderiaceae bacterium]